MRAQFSGTLPERGSVSILERREVLPTDKRPEEKWRGVVSQCAPSGWHSWQRWLEHEDVAKKKKNTRHTSQRYTQGRRWSQVADSPFSSDVRYRAPEASHAAVSVLLFRRCFGDVALMVEGTETVVMGLHGAELGNA